MSASSSIRVTRRLVAVFAVLLLLGASTLPFGLFSSPAGSSNSRRYALAHEVPTPQEVLSPGSRFQSQQTPLHLLPWTQGSGLTPASRVPEDLAVAVEGWVRDKSTGAPVAGGLVSLGGSPQTRTDEQGHFAFDVAQIAAIAIVPAWRRDLSGQSGSSTSGAPGGPREVSVSVQAAGYGEWTLSGAVYYPGDTLRLYPRLEPASHGPVVQRVPGPESARGPERGDLPPGAARPPTQTGVASSEVLPLTSDSAPLAAPPASIRVYRTQTGVVEVVPFREYVKHVLPMEWIPTWGSDSLMAGAMAAKSYAWYWISRGGKRPELGADLKDNTDDQVYDPNVSYASTDAAVEATFRYMLTIDGALFQTQYCAGYYSGEATGHCPWSGPAMSQWGSAYLADQGRPWNWITQYYFPGSVLTPNPPGSGHTPLPTAPPRPTPIPPTAAPSFTIGQGSTRADLFQEAYDRNGGAPALGRPTGPARWWLNNNSPNDVFAQPFSGPGGRGNVWIAYDALKAPTLGVQRAFVLSGAIASGYAAHTPPGPEWVGAPTSDPYDDQAGAHSQGFARGTLVGDGPTVQFAPWPQQFGGWKAEYFPGHSSVYGPPSFSLPGQPASVRDMPSPNFDWSATPGIARSVGAGQQDWSVQLTADIAVTAGAYDLSLTADDGGLRLWVDGALALDGWQDRQGINTLVHSPELANGLHTVRIQYYSPRPGGKLQFKLGSHVSPTQQVTPSPAAKSAPRGQATLRVRVNWLGRQQPPSDNWAQPLTLALTVAGNPAVLVGAYPGATDRNGVAFYRNLPDGRYDVHVKGRHSLQSARASISLAAGSTTDLDMKTQVEGDVDGDNCVTVGDFSVVQGMLGAHKDLPGFFAGADLNNDGFVAMNDISLLRSGFERCGDISADNEFRVMSTNAPPSLAQALAPWTNPSALKHNLTLGLSASNSIVRAGDVVAFAVIAQTGSQSIDGASFMMKYDPKRFAPVDAAGNVADKIEPGLSLPAVMGNWLDAAGGGIGYSAGMLQGDPPTGRVIVATMRFRALTGAGSGTALFSFAPAPSPFMQLTNGGDNLLSRASDLAIQVTP